MNGTYRGYSPALMAGGILVGIFSAFLLISNEPAVLIVFLVLFVAGMVLVVLSLNMPCRVRAGNRGFTVTVFGFENKFRYDDIKDISCEYRNTRYGGMIYLYVRDDHGETVFHELCDDTDMTEMLNDSANAKKPQLAKLCDFVKQAKGAEV